MAQTLCADSFDRVIIKEFTSIPTSIMREYFFALVQKVRTISGRVPGGERGRGATDNKRSYVVDSFRVACLDPHGTAFWTGSQ